MPAKHILVVEDERIVALDIQRTLIELGYTVPRTAATAEDAIRFASDLCPDLVLMDIRIKGERDGIETAQILRTRFGVPIVYLTAHADAATVERAKGTEPLGYLLKPVKPGELRSTIEIALYRHEMDRRLRERDQWHSAALRSIADAVITVDLTGKITFVNHAAEGLIGTTNEQAIGKSVEEVLQLTPISSGMGKTPLATALRLRQAVTLEEASVMNVSTGALHVINDSATPVMDGERMLGAAMVFRDVTEKKKLTKQLELADRLTSLGTMAAGVAHELNNPLAIVVANAGFIAEELQGHRATLETIAIPSEVQRLDRISAALGDLQSAASRLGRIVSDLRAFSRPAEQTSEWVDVNRCVEWALRATEHEFHHRAKLVTDLTNIPRVKGDETRIGQVIINLLINAAQAIAPGSADRNQVTVSTRSEADNVVLRVRDTGGGIPAEVLSRIFEPFFTTKPVGVGTGLGLSICHGIVRSLGGDIKVDTEVGKGTTFRLEFPAPPAMPASPEPVRNTTEAAQPLRGRILIVDDEAMMLHVIQRILQNDGHDVVCRASAAEALDLLRSAEHFDVIASDVMMPTMTGLEFYETLVSQDPDLARRIIFMTGGAITEKVDAFLQAVPNQKIQKPFKASVLREAIQVALRVPRHA